MKILFAIDGSDFSLKILDYVCTHESLFGKHHEYTLLNVQTPLPGRARAMVGKEMVDDYYRDEAEKVLATAAQHLQRYGIQAQQRMEVGHAAQTIARVADEGGFDLLIMGTHGHGAWLTLVLGSVASAVLAHSKVAVLLVR